MRVLQLGPRPGDFLSVMANESELLEMFGIKVFPVALPDLEERVLSISSKKTDEIKDLCHYFRNNFCGRGSEDEEIMKNLRP